MEAPVEGNKKPFYVGVVVISPDHKRILLAQRTEDGGWTGPGGGAEMGESPKEAAIREAFEEANLVLDEEDLEELPMLYAFNGKPIHTYLVVLQEPQKISPHNDPDKEVEKWIWHPLDKPIPEPMAENRRKTILNAKLHLFRNVMEKAALDGEDLAKGKPAMPVGSSSPDGKYIKTAMGWRRKSDLGRKPHTATVKMEHNGKMIEKKIGGIYGTGHQHVLGRVQGLLGKMQRRHPGLKIHRIHVAEDRPEQPHSEVHPEMKKSNVQSEIQLPVDLNTADQSMDEAGALGNIWFSTIEREMHDAPLMGPVKFIALDGPFGLHLSKVDEGMYSGYVKKMSEEDFGEIVLRLEKMTAASIIQALKAREFIRQNSSVANGHAYAAAMDAAGDAIEEQERQAEAQAKARKLEMVETLVGHHSGKNASVEEDAQMFDLIMALFGLNKSQYPTEDLAQALLKGRPALPIGTIRIWNGQKYVKHADGWIAVSGKHHGKRMGAFGADATHKEFADEHHEAKAAEEEPKGEEKEPELDLKGKREAKEEEPKKELKPLPDLPDDEETEARLQALEAEGMTRSDAQGVLEAEKLKEQSAKNEPEKKGEEPKEPESKEEKGAEESAETSAEPEAEEKPKRKKREPKKKDNPRAEVDAEQADRDEEEYEFARKSDIGNLGEDIKNSARHIRNQWNGLEQAEKDGLADKLVKRDVLMKADPIDAVSPISNTNYLAPLAVYMSLKAFPPTPKSQLLKYHEGKDENHPVRVEVKGPLNGMKTEFRHPGASSIKNGQEEVVKTYTKGEWQKKLRKEYVAAFDRMNAKAKELLKSGETDPRKMFKAMRDECEAIIKEAREGDRYSEIANTLVKYHKDLYSPSGESAWDRGGKIYQELNEFAKLGIKSFGENEHLEEKSEKFAEAARNVAEGMSVEKAFGVESNRNRFNPADLYVGQAKRTGPEHKGISNKAEQEKMFMNHMKMRGLQWGNSATDEEREHHMKKSSEAFLDLADVLGLPKEMTSFNGRLGLAIGARGKGTALAHYEPDQRVINLTRKSGVGSLAHEWGHFFDNILSELHGSGKSGYFSEKAEVNSPAGVDSQVEVAMQQLVKSPVWRNFYRRMRESDQFRKLPPGGREYWSSTLEMFARSFEKYVSHKLEKMGRENTYLAGVSPHPFWPDDAEVKEMAPMFDKLFEAFKNSDMLKKALELLTEKIG